MAWIELLDESRIGVAGGIAEIDPEGKLKIPDDGISRALEQSDISGLTTALAGKVPTSTKINGKALSDDITIGQADISGLTAALAGKVPTSTKINGKPLTGNITLSNSDVGLGNVEDLSPEEIRDGITIANITGTGIKTGHLINSVTGDLPTTGYSEGDIIRKGGKLYVWKDAS